MKLSPSWLADAQKFLMQKPTDSSQAVLVVGDVGWDKFVWGSVDRISPEAPVPILKIEKELQKPGLAANVAQNLVEFSEKWRVPVFMTSVLGKDTYGEQMREHFASLGKNFSADLILDETISGKIAKDVFLKLWETGKSPIQLVDDLGLKQITDVAALENMIDTLMAENAEKVAEYRAGKQQLFGFFVGLAMKATQGKGNPAIINGLLKKKLN